MCCSHYKRWYKYGDPAIQKQASKAERKSHPLYGLYCNIRNRCYNLNNPAYKDYGGRGITMCDRWLGIEGFDNFVLDMGTRLRGYSIERVDNEIGYSPDNCKWATPYEQSINRRIRKDNSTGIAGVHKRPSGRYSAEITRKSTRKYLGTYLTLGEAANARSIAEATV